MVLGWCWTAVEEETRMFTQPASTLMCRTSERLKNCGFPMSIFESEKRKKLLSDVVLWGIWATNNPGSQSVTIAN
jgi:hypothetical protein